MSEDKKASPRANAAYPHRMSHYEDDAGMKLLRELAKKRGGVSVTALLRQLTREEAGRVGIVAEA